MKHDAKDEVEIEKINVDDPNADTPPTGYSDEEWSDLSPTEKAGILESIKAPEGEEEPEAELTEEQKAELAAIADGEKTPEQRAADEAAAETARIAEKAKTEGKTADEIIAAEAATPETDKTDDDLLSFRATLTAEETPVFEEKEEVIPAEIQKKFDENDAKFDAGDIDKKAYDTERDKINRQIMKYNADLNTTAKAEVEEQKSDLVWKKEQIYFLNAKPEYMPSKAMDAAGKAKSNALFGALTEMVKAITGDPQNLNLTGMQVLVKADKAVKEVFGIKPPEKKVAPAKKEEKPAVKIPDVKTLGDLPNAAPNMDGADDSFAQIDKLRGDAYENALERMSPAVKEKYLERASR